MPKFLWTQKEDIGPAPRLGHGLTYDSNRQRCVLFGGETVGGTPLSDTWEWDGEAWTQKADMGPQARSKFAMIYDTQRQRVLLFGGTPGDGQALGDTWEWDGESWTQVEDSGPAPRFDHAAAFDSRRIRAVLFGGTTLAGLANDTWEWDGQQWTQQDETGPSARRAHAMAYERPRQRVVLFGGEAAGGRDEKDTWGWDGAQWTQLSDMGPAARIGAAMAFSGDQLTLFGGLSDNGGLPAAPLLMGQTWQWDGRYWTQKQDIGPGPRWRHALTYDNIAHRLILFGGLRGPVPNNAPALTDLLGDTWEHPVVPAPAEDNPVAALESIVLSPTSIPRGGLFGADHDVTCTVTLSQPAPAGGATVQINAHVPDQLSRQIAIPAAALTGLVILSVHTQAFTPPGDYGIDASLGPVTKTAMLTIT